MKMEDIIILYQLDAYLMFALFNKNLIFTLQQKA